MSYNVDPKTLLFTNDITWEEARGLLVLAEKVVLDGQVGGNHPAFRAWVKAAGHEGNQELLVYATAFPQRALLSLVAGLIPKMRPATPGW